MMSTPPDLEAFVARLHDSLSQHRFVKLGLANYRGDEAGLQRVFARAIELRGERCLSFVHRYATRDVTRNLPLAEGVGEVAALIAGGFAHAHLQLMDEELELVISRRGKATLHSAKRQASEAPTTHDRAKRRFVEIERPWLADLGVTDASQRLIPAMARKWKQINKFVEILDHAIEASALKQAERIRVLDFGSGKGYLTFAVEDHLRHARGVESRVTGVELRPDLVELGNAAARRLDMRGLSFVQGDVQSHAADEIDIMIALHACDTATDHAMHAGIRAGAKIILCAPCCHKQLRPQMSLPGPMRPMLKHGIHLGQEAEMLTDSLRALLLDAQGYDTQVFEFVALEHTSKNKMVLAIRRERPADNAGVLGQIRELKDFFGVREQALETLLLGPRAAAA
jgi:protein-L-isoaspartate O-methyltransferase